MVVGWLVGGAFSGVGRFGDCAFSGDGGVLVLFGSEWCLAGCRTG